MKNVLIFIAGAAVGAVASFFITKEKLNKDHEEETEALRQMYNERVDKIQNASDAIKTLHEKKAAIMQDIEAQVKKEEEEKSAGETDYSAISNNKKKHKEEKKLEPIRVISEREAQKYSKEFELLGLSLYEDNVLIDDETENIIEDFEPWVGVSSLSDLRAVGDESIYILNEERKAIYDITVVDERFGDADEPFTIN